MRIQKRILGAYVKKNIFNALRDMRKALQHMSYMKLEILSIKKDLIYDNANTVESRSRGDISYLKRSEKQYFWSFNGEFWADELGDYVFALRSECR